MDVLTSATSRQNSNTGVKGSHTVEERISMKFFRFSTVWLLPFTLL